MLEGRGLGRGVDVGGKWMCEGSGCGKGVDVLEQRKCLITNCTMGQSSTLRPARYPFLVQVHPEFHP